MNEIREHHRQFPWKDVPGHTVGILLGLLDAADAREAVLREALTEIERYAKETARDYKSASPHQVVRWFTYIAATADAALSTDGSEVLERLQTVERERNETARRLEVVFGEASDLRSERDRMLAALLKARGLLATWLALAPPRNPKYENVDDGSLDNDTRKWLDSVRSIPGVLSEEGEKK